MKQSFFEDLQANAPESALQAMVECYRHSQCTGSLSSDFGTLQIKDLAYDMSPMQISTLESSIKFEEVQPAEQLAPVVQTILGLPVSIQQSVVDCYWTSNNCAGAININGSSKMISEVVFVLTDSEVRVLENGLPEKGRSGTVVTPAEESTSSLLDDGSDLWSEGKTEFEAHGWWDERTQEFLGTDPAGLLVGVLIVAVLIFAPKKSRVPRHET